MKRVSLPIKDNGKISIAARLEKDGTLSLSVDGGNAATVKAPATLDRQPMENLCIGHDDANPLDEEAPNGKFSGTINAISVTIL